jgi:hypothetical protein
VSSRCGRYACSSMSALEFRASLPVDGPAITELCQRVLQVAPGSPMFAPSLLGWKYWRPWPNWSGARSYVITRGGEIVAHIAAIPVTFHEGGAAWTLLHPLDWAARPDVIGAGAMLLQRLSTIADGVVVVGGSAITQRMLGPLGFRSLPGVHRYAAALDGDVLDGHVLDRDVVQESELETRPLAPGEAPPALEQTFAPLGVAARSAALIDLWRECPALVTRALRVVDAGVERGGFVLSLAAGQARLIDVWCVSQRSADWARVLRAARREAQRIAGVAEVVTLANTALEARALAEAGFAVCGELPMLVKARAPHAPGAGLRFQLLDGDAAFLHAGTPERWLGARAAR